MKTSFIFLFTLTFLLGGISGYLFKTKTSESEIVQFANNSAIQNYTGVDQIKIDPYRLDTKNGDLIATFQLEIQNTKDTYNKVTYWTDKIGACNAKTEKLTNLVEVPVDNSTYTFFQFTDTNGATSQIYASSHNPIFQCGQLAE